MTAHVFIVDDNTFPVHLQYGFAGTGAREHALVDFNNSPSTVLFAGNKHPGEHNLVGMIADINRVRKGDRVFFYAQQPKKEEGRFFGMFRAAEDAAFIDNGGKKKQYLLGDLGKSLTFRVLLEPDAVYPQGVTEWEALDVIRDIQHPHQMLWSLIYRKLKGNRGCVMITSYEEERLCALIKHGQQPLNLRGRGLDFDVKSREIVVSGAKPNEYRGEKTPISLLPKIGGKHYAKPKKQQYEKHLQAHIVGQFGRKGDELTRLLIGAHKPNWLGNEVGCGVGMQSIDVMVSYTGDKHGYIMPIELKSVPANADNIRQIRRYVDWIEQYYLPNRPSIIAPVLITQTNPARLPPAFVAAAQKFNEEIGGRTCEPLRLVEFDICGGALRFQTREI